jgi:addiction module RelE/StbE family toxin
MRVLWARKALADLQAIRTYIEHDKPLAAQAVAGRIRECSGLLAEHPELGKAGRVPGTREIVIAGLPFILVYRVTNLDLQVLRVLHTSLQYP